MPDGQNHNNGYPSLLVVEDDPQINELVGQYGQLCGLEYRPALTGGAALREVAGRKPRLMILDIMLPDIDGLEVCRRIKTAGNGQAIPILILSALAGPQDIERGRAAGADEYLAKPFDPETLLAAIRRYGGCAA